MSGQVQPIRRLRYDAGLTLLGLAEATGISRQTLGALEAGRVSTPNPKTLTCLAEFFSQTLRRDVTAGELLPVPATQEKAA